MAVTNGRYEEQLVVQTVSAAPNNIASNVKLITGEDAILEAHVFARTNDNAYHVIRCKAVGSGGGGAITAQTSAVIYDSKGITATFTISGGTVSVQVTPSVSTAVDWRVTLIAMART